MYNLVKKHKDLVIILIIFFAVLVFMVILSVTFAFFQESKSLSGQITLGELDYTINVNNVSQNLLLPGDNLVVNVNIENSVNGKINLVPFYFRFKILNGENDYSLDLINLIVGEDYILGENFYYYKYKLKQGEKTQILNRITIDKNLKKEDVQDLDLSILVYAVQSEHFAYKEVFLDAPAEWIEFIENN